MILFNKYLFKWILILFALVYLTLVYFYGLRVPGFHFDNYTVKTKFDSGQEGFRLKVNGGFLKSTHHKFVARAYSPHPELLLSGDLIGFPFTFENIHPDAKLIVNQSDLNIIEEIDNLNRHITVQGNINSDALLRWVFPEKDHYRFMAIGDTGGGGELIWLYKRAAELNSDFIVHLGDMFYSHEDIYSAFTNTQNSSIPVYSVYGNHDYFNGGGYPDKNTYNNVFAPSNYEFSLLGKRFVSLDTSSHIFPFHRGQRGNFLNEIEKNPEVETLFFTHKPISTTSSKTFPELDHGLTGFEGLWLEKKLSTFTQSTVITGHLHESLKAELPHMLIYVAGEGLAHKDFMLNKALAKVLIGDIYKQAPTQFSWELNNIPRNYHVSFRANQLATAMRYK